MKMIFSGDQAQLQRQYLLNREEWEAAIAFLLRDDLATLETGKHILTPNGTYAAISEYDTRPEGKFEAHRKYIDIQYLVSGKEFVQIASMSQKGEEIVPFDETKDIEFFKVNGPVISILLDREHPLVLFPSDAHAPCVSASDVPIYVRKIVIKVPFVE